MQFPLHLLWCIAIPDLKSGAAANVICNVTSSSAFHCSYVKDTVHRRAVQVLCFKITLVLIWEFRPTCVLCGYYFWTRWLCMQYAYANLSLLKAKWYPYHMQSDQDVALNLGPGQCTKLKFLFHHSFCMRLFSLIINSPPHEEYSNHGLTWTWNRASTQLSYSRLFLSTLLATTCLKISVKE